VLENEKGPEVEVLVGNRTERDRLRSLGRMVTDFRHRTRLEETSKLRD
jgi:hypothetical protein